MSYPRTVDDVAYDFRKYEPQQFKSKLKRCGFEVLLLSRVHAMLGFAETVGKMRATRKNGAGYDGPRCTVAK